MYVADGTRRRAKRLHDYFDNCVQRTWVAALSRRTFCIYVSTLWAYTEVKLLIGKMLTRSRALQLQVADKCFYTQRIVIAVAIMGHRNSVLSSGLENKETKWWIKLNTSEQDHIGLRHLPHTAKTGLLIWDGSFLALLNGPSSRGLYGP